MLLEEQGSHRNDRGHAVSASRCAAILAHYDWLASQVSLRRRSARQSSAADQSRARPQPSVSSSLVHWCVTGHRTQAHRSIRCHSRPRPLCGALRWCCFHGASRYARGPASTHREYARTVTCGAFAQAAHVVVPSKATLFHVARTSGAPQSAPCPGSRSCEQAPGRWCCALRWGLGYGWLSGTRRSAVSVSHDS